MKSKSLKIVLLFIIMVLLVCTISNAQTMGEIERVALNNLDQFFGMNIEGITNGSTDVGKRTKAVYCMDVFDHRYANHGMMRTAVVDVGANGISSVNNLSTSNSEAARKAMQVLYYATKSYQNNEPWGASQRSPYRLMMQFTSALNATTMVNAGLFNSGLPSNVTEKYVRDQFGSNRYNQYKAEGEAYVNSITNGGGFSDKSAKDVQTIEEVGEWVFVGPYNIENTGSGSITRATVTTQDGTNCNADGWASSPNTGAINGIDSIPNGSTFYLAFKNQKPDSAERVELEKKTSNVLRARMVFFASDGGQNMAVYGGDLNREINQTIQLPKVNFSSITIVKMDPDKSSNNKLAGIGFQIYCEGQGYVKDGVPAKYVSKEDATTYITNNNGEVKIKNLNKRGKYIVYEVINPYFGYQPVSISSPLNVQEIQMAAIGQNFKIQINNKRIYIKLSGYAWEDTLQGKQTLGDNQYNGTGVNDSSKAKKEQDKRIANVKVTLRKANGEIIDTRTTKTITNTSGNKEDGAYLFGDYQRDKNAKKILIDDLNGAYIEFEYNGMCYKSIKVNASAANGNKSTDEKSRNAFNDKFSTIENNAAINSKGEKTNLKYDFAENQSKINYEGNYLYGYGNSSDEATKRPTYPIAGVADKYKIIANTKDASGSEKLLLGQTTYEFANLRKNSVEEIPNINLGVSEREQPDMRIENDVENVELTINNKTHRYTYGSKKLSDFNVNQDDSTYFNVGVSFKNKFTGVYKRAVYQADYNYTIDPDKPSDRKLQVYMIYRVAVYNESTNLKERLNSIIQYYDSRYEIDSIGTKLDSGTGAIENGTSPKVIKTEETNGYKKAIIEYPIEVNAQEVNKNIYIRFKLKDEAVLEALNKTNDSEFKTLTEINSYSTLDADGKAYAGIDRDSNPGNAEINKSSDFEDDTSAAPGIQLAVEGNRQLSGIVFEDKEITKTLQKDNERIGNGIYDEGESRIGKIVVTMTEKTGSKAVYTTKTNDDGIFNLPDGFIPGNYTITYTWGGKENSKYNVKDYKATIWTPKNEEEKEKLGDNWYKPEVYNRPNTRYSDAKDNYETRQNIDYGGIETVDDNSNNAELKTMESTTNLMNMEVEYNSIYNTVKDENVDKFIPEGFDVKNIDFGLILRPKQKLTINKSVYKFKATLANGQVIADCTIEDGKLVGEKNSLTYMGPLKTGNTATSNGTVKLELDNELIQGANIEIQYRITIKNESEKDYQTQEYYENGENRNNPVTITPTKIYDYLDTELAYQESENWEVVSQQDRTFTKTLEENITKPSKDNKWNAAGYKELKDGSQVKYLYRNLGEKNI